MFDVGDKVLYPMHGAGVIESIEEKEVLGETSAYYAMTMPFGSMSVLIPVDTKADIGLRPVVPPIRAREVLSNFGKCTMDENASWNKRYRENMDRIRGGDIDAVSDVVYTLMKREHEKGLSTGERKMLISARQILISEISLSVDCSCEEIEMAIAQVFND
ncbi:RNA polymerase-binding transcription factor CarD [bioreactor metagenome]|uniref:RNA polymerase-binding transcription factor CarD n=1 Tax=bioreactor metagenome TaxID=1076179 RepID=A0A644X8T1_9ZZZZ